MTITVNVQDAKTRLSELIKRVEAGEDVVIARSGRPIVALRPVEAPKLVYGLFAHLGPVPEAFFDSLPDDDLARWADGGPGDPLSGG